MKRTKITVRTDQVRVIRRRRSCGMKWCEPCAAPAEMLSPEEAAVVSDLSLRAIFRLVEGGELHFTETLDGLLWICFNSLLEQTNSNFAPERKSLED